MFPEFCRTTRLTKGEHSKLTSHFAFQCVNMQLILCTASFYFLAGLVHGDTVDLGGTRAARIKGRTDIDAIDRAVAREQIVERGTDYFHLQTQSRRVLPSKKSKSKSAKFEPVSIGKGKGKGGGSSKSKGSKGKGGKGGKGSKGSKQSPSKGSKGGSSCIDATVYYLNEDFTDSFEGEGLVGTNGDVPVYDENGRKVGTYTETTVAVGQFNCITNGVYSFDFNRDGIPESQIFVSQTCCGTDTQSIVGGTGGYQCATGFTQEVNKGGKKKTFRRIVACESASCIA